MHEMVETGNTATERPYFRAVKKLLEKYEKSLDKSLKVWYSNKAVREGGGRKRRKRESHGGKDWKNLKKVLDKNLKLW